MSIQCYSILDGILLLWGNCLVANQGGILATNSSEGLGKNMVNLALTGGDGWRLEEPGAARPALPRTCLSCQTKSFGPCAHQNPGTNFRNRLLPLRSAPASGEKNLEVSETAPPPPRANPSATLAAALDLPYICTHRLFNRYSVIFSFLYIGNWSEV